MNTKQNLNSTERREAIKEELKNATEPIAAAKLAAKFFVSRQVIVQDIALIKVENKDIVSTSRGYLWIKHDGYRAILPVFHDAEKILEELYIIVDSGAKILDVFVEHEVYGCIKSELLVNSRRDADRFLEKMKKEDASPLSELTKGYHFHTIEVDTLNVLDDISTRLKAAGILQGEIVRV